MITWLWIIPFWVLGFALDWMLRDWKVDRDEDRDDAAKRRDRTRT